MNAIRNLMTKHTFTLIDHKQKPLYIVQIITSHHFQENIRLLQQANITTSNKDKNHQQQK